MISYMSVPICNHFHTRQANTSKKRLLEEVPLFDALIQGEPPSPKSTKFCHDELESLGQPTVKI